MKGYVATATCALWVLLVSAGCLSARGEHDLQTFGLEYRLQELSDPRPNRVHILRVDLAKGKIKPVVVIAAHPIGNQSADAVLTDPLKLAADASVLAFVNTNPWANLPGDTAKWYEGQPVIINGLAVSGGHVRSSVCRKGSSVWVDERGRVFMGDPLKDSPVAEGMSGFQQMVKDGSVIVPAGGAVHPRTAIGVDRTGSVLWLVVVDGRQPGYSEGMNLYELSGVMSGLGCWNATNMDGGGSSVMGLREADGTLHVVNSPSDRVLGVARIRPLPMILTIRQTAGSRLKVE